MNEETLQFEEQGASLLAGEGGEHELDDDTRVLHSRLLGRDETTTFDTSPSSFLTYFNLAF